MASPSDPPPTRAIPELLASIESAGHELARALPESPHTAAILARVAAIRRGQGRRPLPVGWRWVDAYGDWPSMLANDPLCKNLIAEAHADGSWRVPRPAGTVPGTGKSIDEEDARVCVEDYLWEKGWPT